MRGIFLIAVTGLIALSSCSRGNMSSAQKQSLDSLKILLAEVEGNVEAINDKVLKDWMIEVEENVKYLDTYYRDFSDRRFWIDDMSDYYRSRKKFRKYLAAKEQMMREAAYSKEQLHTLKNSLKQGVLDKAQVEEYIRTEREAISRLHYKVTNSVKEITFVLSRLDTIGPKVNRIISEIKDTIQ